MTLAEAYLQAALEDLERLRRTQLDAIDVAADHVATAWRRGGWLFVARTQHSLHSELVGRASGPVAARVLDDGGATHDELVESLPDVRPGDVVLIHSNCGSTRKTVSIAESATRQGAISIALTQVAFERSDLVRCAHPSGRLLHEVADLTVDLGGVVGDGALGVPGTELTVGPTSGVTGAAAAWSIVARACERIAEDGGEPLVLRAVQLPNAEDHNRAAIARWAEKEARNGSGPGN